MKDVKSMMVGMLAETFIHPGMGQTVGVVDLPVARESATSYPYIAGSSLKGALRSAYERGKGIKQKPTEATEEDSPAETKRNKIFGDDKQQAAGNVLVSDARLLLLPVRSLSSSYKWVTCPHLLERLARDRKRCGLPCGLKGIASISKGEAIAQEEKDSKLFLEERSFIVQDKPTDEIIALLQSYIPNQHVAERLKQQLVILNDDAFVWFARYALAVHARNVLDENKTSVNLWYEETIPPDTLMYSILAARHHNANDHVAALQQQIGAYLQVGGNETVGQGWFNLQWLLEDNPEDSPEANANEVAHA